MGREKRIAESRTKEILDKKQGSEPRAEAPRTSGAPVAPAPETQAHTGTTRALLQIIALFLIPTVVIILLGKLVFRL